MSKPQLSRLWPKRLGVGGLIAAAASFAIAVPATANIALTRADVQSLLNRVEMIPRGRSPRPARMSDFLSRGDALRTAAASRAELRFNDGSLARLGERATFRFVPNTRNFRLSNGTVLLLIPPGRGRSTLQTPNAVTGIQGSALVVRYSETTNLTLVMALTENPDGLITITNGDDQQEYSLRAGEMALVQNGVVKIFEFDLRHFYGTSTLVEGLELDERNGGDSSDPTGAVRAETVTALESQTEFTAEAVLNPEALSVEENQASPEAAWFVENTPSESFGTSVVGVRRYSTLTGSGLVTAGSDPANAASSVVVSSSSSPSTSAPPAAAAPTPAATTPPTSTPATPPPVTPAPASPAPSAPAAPTTPAPASPAPPAPANPAPSSPAPPASPAPANPVPTPPAAPTTPAPATPAPTPPATPAPTPPTPSVSPTPGNGNPPVNPNPGSPATPSPGTGGGASPNPGSPASPATSGPPVTLPPK